MTGSISNHPFSGAMLVLGRVSVGNEKTLRVQPPNRGATNFGCFCYRHGKGAYSLRGVPFCAHHGSSLSRILWNKWLVFKILVPVLPIRVLSVTGVRKRTGLRPRWECAEDQLRSSTLYWKVRWNEVIRVVLKSRYSSAFICNLISTLCSY